MSKERYIFKRKDLRKLFKVFLALSVIFTLFSPWLKTTQHIARAVDDDLIHNIQSLGDNITVAQKGCDIVVKKKDKTHWAVPRKPIDLVILQDASGSFENTIGNVKAALSQLTTPVDAINYDPDNPRLVFTGDPDTTDRVMVASFKDLDGYRLYDKQQQPSASSYVDTSGRNYDPEKRTWYSYSGNDILWWDNSINNWVTKYETDTNFTGNYREGTWDGSKYTLESSNLTNDKTAIHNFINSITTRGGTPTVPAIEDIINKYNSVKGNMNNDRKTVFLLITDGVANGVRKDGKVVIEYSGKRNDKLLEKYGIDPLDYQQMEGSSNILARADELTKVGAKLKQAVGEKGSVVVGFWEDLKKLTTYGQYYNIYDNGFRDTGINFGDNRSVREIFSTALRSLASPDKVINGKNATFYVNEQNDIQAFSNKVLASVGNALIKENVQGDFTVTEGYRVKSVSINHKKVVDKETIDKEHEIRGTIKQDGNNVTISVPDAAFNPGENKFDYELVNTVEQPNLSEDEEVPPADDYTPTTEDKKVGQLVGYFHVGKYQTALIGSKEERTVKVNSLKYCYPNVKKAIKDKNTTNDKADINDPVLEGKKSYGAVLDDVREEFDYTVDYRMNHIPLNFEKNAMLIDPIDYRLDVIDAYVTETGSTQRLTDFTIRKVNETDSVTKKERTVVVADIPQKPGTKTDSVDEGNYGGHKFKKYTLHVKVKIKDEYPYEKSQKDYIKILQENDGYGLRNQASIKWNGETNNPSDDTAQVRRSNNVFVVPPVKTDIDKKVRGESETVDQGREHYYLPQRYDKFIYDIKSSWPGLMDSYSIEDQLEPELEVNKADIKVMVNNKEITDLKDHITVENNLVKLSLVKNDITPKLNRAIQNANKGNNGPAQIHIEIKAKIKDGANIDRFKDDNGVINVPNKATVKLNNQPTESKTVYVTPNEPTVTKKINNTLDHLNIPSWDKKDNAYNYNIKTTLPGNIDAYNIYKIEDVLDQDLELQEGKNPTIKGEVAAHFDVSYDSTTRTVTAKVKDGHFNQLTGKSIIELEIPAKIKDGVSREKIPNIAKVFYNTTNATGEPKKLETPPVTVTPPPSAPTKKINETLDDLVINSASENAYNYNIKSKLPGNIAEYKQYGIKDKLDDRLELQEGKQASIKGGNAEHFDVTYDKATNTVVAKVKEGHFENLKGVAEVELVIPAKIKDGVTEKKIPNEATVIFNQTDANGEPKETPKTPPVTVTPPPPSEPPITKTVNDKTHEDLTSLTQEFVYKIETQVPKHATAFEVTDTIKDVLEFKGAADIEATVDGETITDVKTEGKTLTVKLSDDQVKNKAGKNVVVKFKARLKDNLKAEELTEFTTEDVVRVPNTAKYKINLSDEPKFNKESQPVTVTPPKPNEPGITKKVNNQEHVNLTEPEEVFTYKIETTVPTNATEFSITDTLVDELEFGNNGTPVSAKVENDFIDNSNITIKGQTLTVKLSDEQVRTKAGKAVVVEFVAKVKQGANISKYTEKKVPNKATYHIDNKFNKDSNTVTVTPPPSKPEISKKVNEANQYDLPNRNDEFTYTITTQMPNNANIFEITDELKEVLQFVGEKGNTVVKIDGKEAGNKATINIKGQKLQVSFTEESVKGDAGKVIEVTFKAKIREGANLSNYIISDKIQVPNKASYDINNDPKYHKDSNVVPVIPPTPGEPEIKKDVNGKASETLQNRDEEFTYNITTKVPEDATAFEVHDTIEGVLEFSGDKGGAKATLDGKDLVAERITTDGQTIKVTLTEDEVKANGGKEVKLSFKAKIKAGANLSGYVTKEGQTQVPNKAQYRVDLPNKPGVTKDSNVVPVTPPTPGEPEIKKDVNGKASETLQNRDEEFTYNITTKVPEDATAFEVHDTIEGVLEFSGDKGGAKATLDGKDLVAERITTDGQTIKVTLTEDEVKANGGKEVKLSFKAKIKAGANLSGYVTKEGQTQVPNKAQYRVDLPNKPGVTKDSNVVPVTPPPSDPTKPNIVKTVNNKQQQVLSKIDEEFVYRISTTMPENAEQFNVLDKLESVLEFSGKPEVSVNGKKVNTKITQNDGELNVEFKGDFVKQNAGKSIEIEFKAKITKDADLSKYRDSGYAVPNEARYIVNNDPKITGKTPPVFVTPPPIKIVPPKPGEKSINSENGEENETLRELKVNNEVFRYDIKERLGINQDYKQFAISDDLEKVLDILKAEVRIDGEKVDTIAVNKELAKLNDELTKVQNKLQQAKGESTARKDAKDSEIKLTDKKQQLEVVNSKIKSEKIREKVVELNKEKVLLEKDIETLTSELAEKQKTIGNNSINKEELEKVVHDLNKQIKDYKESDKFKAIELLNNALSTRNDKNTIDKEALKKIGDLVVKDNTVVFEVTNKDILKLLEGREVTLSIYAKIKDNVDLSKYKDENVIKVPNEAKIIFDHKPKVTNKVYVLPKPKDPTPPPGEVPPIPEIPKEPKPKKPTPPTPEIPTQPKPKKPTPQVPTTKVEKALAKTGVTTSTSTGWLGVIGLIALLFVRKYSNNRKDK